MNQNELYHYGVLGMRWGVRRARKMIKKGRDMQKSSDGERRIKGQRLEKRGMKKMDKHRRRSGGQKTLNYTQNESLGKTVLKSILFGTYGALYYNEVKAQTHDRAQAWVAGKNAQFRTGVTFGLAEVISPRMREKSMKKYEKQYGKDALQN